MFKKIYLMGAMLAMAGCHSNPYDGIQGHLTPTPPVSTKPAQPGGGCQVQSEVDVAESKSVPVSLSCVVPTGTPVVTFVNMPTWMTYDVAANQITVSPPAGAASDPANPTDTTRSYVVTVNVSPSNAPSSVVSQDIVVIVHHVAQSATIVWPDAQAKISEGTQFQSAFTVQSVDFPNGPFTISAVDLPPGVNIVSTGNPSQFTITYNPGFTTVTTKNTQNNCNSLMCIGFNWKLNVVDPHGDIASLPAFWQVIDVRQNPIVSVPQAIKGTIPTADFYINVVDPNGEVAPKVTAANPSSGTATVSVSASAGPTPTASPFSLIHTVWNGVSASDKGTSQSLSVTACVYSDYSGAMNQCVTTPVQVQF